MTELADIDIEHVDPGPAAGPSRRAMVAVVRSWRCHHAGCGRAFVHARYLVAHLIDIHGEGPAR